MNPIEHPWDDIDRAIRCRSNLPRNAQGLIVAVREKWRNIPQETINNLILGMSK
ncbi:hypothetical protein BDFB_008627 [Asbolus verrucosus]|uniref:DDE 3 domain containing protein n=1 Tax=Asbolus verrucosus TaxID=1661398 RepID=A0A482V876_ASBVE|nr:hypothetical protein BDFB_008627 [Asbolus verrucosus]